MNNNFTFLTLFPQVIEAYCDTSILRRARNNAHLEISNISLLDIVGGNHHKLDDTPYGGGPGELLRVDVASKAIEKALLAKKNISRDHKRVVLMDPAGKKFHQKDAKRLSEYKQIIFVCGRYEGIDARINNFVDESLSIGDFVLCGGELAALAMCDATARMIPGVLGNNISNITESHQGGRLESSQYTRPAEFLEMKVPKVLMSGDHKKISRAQQFESILKTKNLRPDLIDEYPLTDEEKKLANEKFGNHFENPFYWQKNYE
jgi:tRNA (guanine37-N1)-methyltransferase